MSLFIIIFLLILFVLLGIYLQLSQKANKSSYTDEVVHLLQQADIPWCLIPLNVNSDETFKKNNKAFTCSELFFKILHSVSESLTSEVLSWQQIIKILGPEPRSAFQQGIRHIMRFGGSFSCETRLNHRVYMLNGTIVQTAKNASFDSDSPEIMANQPPFSMTTANINVSDSKLNRHHYGIFLTLTDQTHYARMKAEARKIQQENEKLYTILNAIPFPIWTRSNSDKIDYCNKAYAKVLETYPHHVIANQWEIVNNTDVRRIKDLHNFVIKKGEPQSLEITTIRKDEDYILRVTEVPIMYPVATKLSSAASSLKLFPQHTVGCAIDISNEKRNEKVQSQLASIYSQVLEQIEIPFIIFNRESRITLSSILFAKLFDLNHSWLQQQPFCDDLLEWLRDNRKLPEYISFSNIKEKFKKWIKGIALNEKELWHLPNGSILNLSATHYPAGGVMISIQDITQTLMLESRYKSLVSVYNEIIDCSHDALLIMGTDHRIKHCSQNTKNILHMAPNNLIGLPVKEFIHNFAQTHHLNSWEESIVTAIELRNNRSEYITLSTNESILCDYLPLPDGGHMLCFSHQLIKTQHEENSLFKNNSIAS